MSQNKKPVALALGTALVGGLALSGSAFAMQPLAQGYMLSAASASVDGKAAEGSCGADKAAEGSCGGDKAKAEGKCGEGKCGMDKMDTDKDGRISKAEFAAAHDGKDAQFAAHDPNGDGFISADEMKAHMEGKCGEGKCGADKAKGDKAGDKAAMDGKCGEGKCGAGA
jgi:uncharacterized low-complexity protein